MTGRKPRLSADCADSGELPYNTSPGRTQSRRAPGQAMMPAELAIERGPGTPANAESKRAICCVVKSLSGSSAPARDRKSVVAGKSVYVRVDLGGRRIIKKKNTSHKVNKTIKP